MVAILEGVLMVEDIGDCHRIHFRPKLYLNLVEFPLNDEKIWREYTTNVHTLFRVISYWARLQWWKDWVLLARRLDFILVQVVLANRHYGWKRGQKGWRSSEERRKGIWSFWKVAIGAGRHTDRAGDGDILKIIANLLNEVIKLMSRSHASYSAVIVASKCFILLAPVVISQPQGRQVQRNVFILLISTPIYLPHQPMRILLHMHANVKSNFWSRGWCWCCTECRDRRRNHLSDGWV